MHGSSVERPMKNCWENPGSMPTALRVIFQDVSSALKQSGRILPQSTDRKSWGLEWLLWVWSSSALEACSRCGLKNCGASSGQTGQPSGLQACAQGHCAWLKVDYIRDVQIRKLRVRVSPQILTKIRDHVRSSSLYSIHCQSASRMYIQPLLIKNTPRVDMASTQILSN